MIILMTRKIRLGYRPRIALMTLYPKDSNVKHDYVEQRELGCVTQVTKEKLMIEFVARARKEKKDGGGKAVPPIM